MSIKKISAILISILLTNLSYADTDRHEFEQKFPKKIELFAVQYYMCAYRLYEADPDPSQKDELRRRVDKGCVQKEKQFIDSLSSLDNIAESPKTSFLHYRMLVLNELFMKMDGKTIPGDKPLDPWVQRTLSCSDAIDDYKKNYIACLRNTAKEIITYSDESAFVVAEAASVKCDKIIIKNTENINKLCAFSNSGEATDGMEIFKNKYNKIIMGEIVNFRVELQKRREQQSPKKDDDRLKQPKKKSDVDA
jgi:hypothetical protein